MLNRRLRRSSLLCVVVVACIGICPAAGSTAIEQFQTLQQALKRDRVEKDWRAYLADAQRLRVFLNDSPLSNLEVARAELQLGDDAGAALATKRFRAMGQVNPILATPAFAKITSGLDAAVKTNESPISQARTAFAFSDSRLLPEDIDYDSRSQRFFVTSILEKKIVTMDASGTAHDFAAAPDHWPMVALKIDAERRILWATEAAFDGFAIVPKADWGRSILLEYDLGTGKLLSRIEGPRGGNLGDMALAANGDPIVSDGDGGGIYRAHDGGLARIDHGDFISPQTVAICADPAVAYVPDYVRGLAAMNLATGAVRWLATQGRYDLDGIDGLYCKDSALIAAQNGASPERVVEFVLDRSRSRTIAQHIVERAGRLGDPTHGVFVGNAFYYIANSGWDAVDEHGRPKAAAAHAAARIMRFDMPGPVQGDVK